MARWTVILLAVMVGAAIAGFLIDAVRILATIAFLACAATLAVRYLKRSK